MMLQALAENLMLPVILAGDWDAMNRVPDYEWSDNLLDQFMRIAPVATKGAAAGALTLPEAFFGPDAADYESDFSVADEAGAAQVSVRQLLAEQAKTNTTFAAVFSSAPTPQSHMHLLLR
jgi:hypothetical protein